MKKKQNSLEAKSGLEECFTITVDGKDYGPFLSVYLPRMVKLRRMAGVELKEFRAKSGWIPFEQPKPPRSKKDKTTPLLDGLDFMPVAKRRHAP